jgi:hypothetical protein
LLIDGPGFKQLPSWVDPTDEEREWEELWYTEDAGCSPLHTSRDRGSPFPPGRLVATFHPPSMAPGLGGERGREAQAH